MADHIVFTMENRERIQAVENTFGPGGKLLSEPGRVLMGEGRLLKLCRRRPQPKVFFLFNDILVYGSIVVPGRWNNSQQVINLKEVQQENLEEGVGMTNQWLLRTPRKSFYVAAASAEEKWAWMQHIENCRAEQLRRLGLPSEGEQGDLAATWIPDRASAVCMRCSESFGITQRRHHCRRCGFVVCNGCSKSRAMLPHISAKPVRVCQPCRRSLQEQEENSQKSQPQVRSRSRGGSVEDKHARVRGSTPEYEASSDEDTVQAEHHAATPWFGPQQDTFSPYCYFKPEHEKPCSAGHGGM